MDSCPHIDLCGDRCSATPNVRTFVAPTKYDCSHLVGQFLDESHFDVLIDEDCDCYAPPSGLNDSCGEHNVLFKLRKGVYTLDEMKGAYDGLIGAAAPSQNRGLAAGPKGGKLLGRDWVTDFQTDIIQAMQSTTPTIDGVDQVTRVEETYGERRFSDDAAAGSYVWLRSKIEQEFGVYDGWFERWFAEAKKLPRDQWPAEACRVAKYVSQTTYANQVLSGIAGFFDRYPRIPYARATSYTEKNPSLFALAFPYLHKLDRFFSNLLPQRYAAQREAASKLDQRFLVDGTVFTTITVNKNFRTAAHYDAGDLATGFSNLGVVTNGKDYRGGYLVLPEYRVAINIRPGDVLLINNHEGLHGNTPIEGDEGFERMSVVCYFREKMLEAGSWEYEDARRQFVAHRSKNEKHPNWRPLWNGVSENMWEGDEWFDFLKSKLGEEVLLKYHPSALNTKTSLEAFF